MTNEELQKQIVDLNTKVDALTKTLEYMTSNGTFPYEIGVAIKDRLSDEFSSGGSSATSPVTYTQTVNESGSATYDVAKVMTGFISITFGGNTYNIPYYT